MPWHDGLHYGDLFCLPGGGMVHPQTGKPVPEFDQLLTVTDTSRPDVLGVNPARNGSMWLDEAAFAGAYNDWLVARTIWAMHVGTPPETLSRRLNSRDGQPEPESGWPKP